MPRKSRDRNTCSIYSSCYLECGCCEHSSDGSYAQRVEMILNWRVQYLVIRSFVCSFARLLAPLTHLLALHAALARSAALIHALACSLAQAAAHLKQIFLYGMNASILHLFKPLCPEAMSPHPLLKNFFSSPPHRSFPSYF